MGKNARVLAVACGAPELAYSPYIVKGGRIDSPGAAAKVLTRVAGPRANR